MSYSVEFIDQDNRSIHVLIRKDQHLNKGPLLDLIDYELLIKQFNNLSINNHEYLFLKIRTPYQFAELYKLIDQLIG